MVTVFVLSAESMYLLVELEGLGELEQADVVVDGVGVVVLVLPQLGHGDPLKYAIDRMKERTSEPK